MFQIIREAVSFIRNCEISECEVVLPNGLRDSDGLFVKTIEYLLYESIKLLDELNLHREMTRGDYWCWQGDGEDRLESLVCPVLIHPQDLIGIIENAGEEKRKEKREVQRP